MSDSKIVHPIHAREGEVVDVHWHCPEGIHVERRECPPRATRDARRDEQKPKESGT